MTEHEQQIDRDYRKLCGFRYDVLFRIIRCLDCEYNQNPLKLCSLKHSQSPLNDQIFKTIVYLSNKGFNQQSIASQLQHIYGKHVISNKRDLSFKTMDDQ